MTNLTIHIIYTFASLSIISRSTAVSPKRAAGKQAAADLLNQLRQHGIFVVPGGEIESWVKGLGATGHGPGWLIDTFERMGEDPSNVNYVRRETSDVSRFVRDVGSWLVDPTRKGIRA